ncbi:MAG TPA: penicillin acylase family protein [Myxococcales bacterium]|nr:penicillin acylase family protein [Myxococcales bacterium]
MRRILKGVGYALAALVALAVLAAAGFRLYAGTAAPDYDCELAAQGLQAQVEIARGARGVPDIRAGSERDLWLALGFSHAEDRLWQMELLRHFGGGRLSEIFGAEGVSTDKLVRTLGFVQAAEREEATLSAEDRAALEAYAAGVNASLRARRGARPPELLVLRHEVEPWTPRDSLLCARVMTFDPSWSDGLKLQKVLDATGPAQAGEYEPAYPAWGPTVLGDAVPPPAPLHLPGAGPVELAPGWTDASRLFERVSMRKASNAWAVGPARSASGKPLIAGDMHVELSAPSVWYLAGLHSGDGVDAAGVTLPGVPAMVSGHTRTVAWGITNGLVDDTDFFLEKVDPASPEQYLAPDGPRPFEVRTERIAVQGGEPISLRVRSTRHGPVVSDVRPSRDRVISVRSLAAEEPTPFAPLRRMLRARDAAELLAGMARIRAPVLNVVYADAGGTIGYHLVGKVPVRAGGDGMLPAPGWTGEYDWQRTLEFSELPARQDPPEGFIVSANERPAGAGYPFLLGRAFVEPFRSLRARQLLGGPEKLTADDLARFQLDVMDLGALRYRDQAVAAARAEGDQASADALAAWDGRADEASRPAALYLGWYEALRRRVFEDEIGPLDLELPRAALDRLLESGAGSFVDDGRTPEKEDLAGLSRAAMREALAEVRGRTWGDLHAVKMEHQLGFIGPLDRLLGLTLGPLPAPGTPFTLLASAHDSTRPPFVAVAGVSHRHVVDFADVDRARFVLPTGISGVPGSEHYDDLLPLWREGRFIELPLDRARADALRAYRAVLRPR